MNCAPSVGPADLPRLPALVAAVRVAVLQEVEEAPTARRLIATTDPLPPHGIEAIFFKYIFARIKVAYVAEIGLRT